MFASHVFFVDNHVDAAGFSVFHHALSCGCEWFACYALSFSECCFVFVVVVGYAGVVVDDVVTYAVSGEVDDGCVAFAGDSFTDDFSYVS